jgi:glycosyltransferase involved in cell wall biosynthesis
LANELGLRNIVFTGFVEKGRQAELWANSVALVVPSIWDEPFGMVVLEAWAHARPVVAFAKGALPELIRHNSDGLLAEPFSESSLAANMKLLLDHPSKATAMGRAGMFRLQNEFTQQNWLKKIQGVYEIVLDRGLSPKG